VEDEDGDVADDDVNDDGVVGIEEVDEEESSDVEDAVLVGGVDVDELPWERVYIPTTAASTRITTIITA
jgi:hypothetical protein